MDTTAVKIKKFFIKIAQLLLELLLRFLEIFKIIGLGIYNGIKGLILGFVKFVKRFIDSSLWTKIGHLFMGVGNIAHKQFVKGFVFLAIQILFFAFIIISPVTKNGVALGAKAIPNFFSLGKSIGMEIGDTEYYEYGFDLIADPNEIDSTLFTDGGAALLQKMTRSNNLLAAIKEGNNPNFSVKENDNSYAGYYPKRRGFSYLIFDTRYDVKDIYAMNKEVVNGSDSSDTVIKFNQTDVVILVSNIKLFETETPVLGTTSNEQKEFVSSYLSFYFEDEEEVNSIESIVYYDRYGSEEGSYIYYLCTLEKTSMYVGLNQEFLAEHENAEVTLYNFAYAPELVTTIVENSFLMLLYGLATFAIIAVFIVIYLLSISSSYKADLDSRNGKKPTSFIDDVKSLLDNRFHITMLAPAVLFMILFTIIPTILMILIAFTDMTGATSTAGTKLINWTGFANFVELFSGNAESQIAREVGRNFLSVFTWTIEWAILATISCYFGGIFLALLINKKEVKYKKLWRTIFILTIAIPQFITLLIIRNLLSTTGPINNFLLNLGVVDKGIDFLGQGSKSSTMNAWICKGSVLVINLYIGIPYTMLMTSGILMNIPSDLYEAATIDGASKWQMFRKITLPYIIFVTTPYLISSFIGNITSFNTIFLTTGGGPAYPGTETSIAGQTDLLVTWLYKMTINEYRYNAGSIISILTFMITASITLICYRNSKAYKEEDTFQ